MRNVHFSKDLICAGHLGHLKPRMFMVNVLEARGKADTTRTCSPGGPRCALLFYLPLHLPFSLPHCLSNPFSLCTSSLWRLVCSTHKDVQCVSPSWASGAMNCLITAGTPYQSIRHQSSRIFCLYGIQGSISIFEFSSSCLFSPSLSRFEPQGLWHT